MHIAGYIVSYFTEVFQYHRKLINDDELFASLIYV